MTLPQQTTQASPLATIQPLLRLLQIPETRTSLRDLVPQIQKARIEARTKRDALQPIKRILAEAEDELVNGEAVLKVEIADELDDKQKPRFSNEATRKAELARRRQEDPDCLGALASVKAAEEKVLTAEHEARQAEVLVENLLDAHRTQLALLFNSTALLEAAVNYKGV